MYIEIMDTTLRDGEQTNGVSFTEKEKFSIAKQLLTEVKVNRIEIASARVSKGEFDSVQRIMEWARKNNFLHQIEVLGFIDNHESINWVHKAGGVCINLLCKGSLKQLTGQLRKSPEDHIAEIKENIAYADLLGISVNVYLEDWSNGMRNSPEYVYDLINELSKTSIKRFMLPDTLGILNPKETYTFCRTIRNMYPNLHFDFHAHNDYDLAVANSLAAVNAGFQGVHTSINGLGERTGNTVLSSIVICIHDHTDFKTTVQEIQLNKISKLVESISGIRVAYNMPIIGENVFTQTAGVHADGDKKGNLYCTDLMPERFGRVRKYALGKTSGKANIEKNLEELGLELEPEIMKLVTQKVVELGDKKETITTEDLPYIVREVLGTTQIEEKVFIENYYVCNAKGLKPVATIKLNVNGEVFEDTSTGDGQYDAVMNALLKIYSHLQINLPKLTDYLVTIPPGGKTDALVETIITWETETGTFKTRGLDCDQTAAAIKATVRMLNMI
ncbi:MAG TPA: alpha-isopropylmalate synthase regulatory domain-containing protein [Bacteroidales bacterium]|nr:MAG: 2-isopropylmalate synthase [Bacteroidetes bacterium ADurb.Bin217]HPM13341.1 alpha-isopropylmalate synthase regulatory domain-containing protein [Bacteroidales bacterium]